jgi:hypothetical protein
MRARADEQPTMLPTPKDALVPMPQQVEAVGPANACCACDSSVSTRRKIWEWLTYRSLKSRGCCTIHCDGPAMPPLYTYFLDCQANCPSGCQGSAPACESTGWRAPALRVAGWCPPSLRFTTLWLASCSDPGKLVRPAP